MALDPVYELRSTRSDIERPSLLRSGSLAACLDELKEAVLIDVVSCNRSTLRITAIWADDREADGGKRADRVATVLTVRTTGAGSA